jgi:hypothetical protein
MGFRKTALGRGSQPKPPTNLTFAGVADADIEYVRLKGLCDPKDGRNAARIGEYDQFQKFSAVTCRRRPPCEIWASPRIL